MRSDKQPSLIKISTVLLATPCQNMQRTPDKIDLVILVEGRPRIFVELVCYHSDTQGGMRRHLYTARNSSGTAHVAIASGRLPNQACASLTAPASEHGPGFRLGVHFGRCPCEDIVF